MKRFRLGIMSYVVLIGIVAVAVSCYQERSGVTQHADVGNLGVHALVSDCGGLKTGSTPLPSRQAQEAQCRDERLLWQYDSHSRVVTFFNENVWLNCCGDHSMTITLDAPAGRYTIRETDAPGESRCLCLCFFDFTIGLPNMPAQSIGIDLYRHVTDDPPQRLIWQGTVDLGQGSGQIVLQKNVGRCK